MLKKYLPIVLAGLAINMVACSSVKVLDETSDTAVIQAEGKSATEAKIEATKKARDLLGEVTESKEAECKPLIRYGGLEVSDVQMKGQNTISGFTDYRCILFFKRK